MAEPTAEPAAAAIREGLARRLAECAELQERTTAYRLLEPRASLASGLGVDVYGQWAVLSCFEERRERLVPAFAEALSELDFRGVYLKRYVRADLRRRDPEELAPPGPIIGEAAPSPLVVREGEQQIAVELGDGLSTGLFLDQRDSRALLRQESRDKTLLNLFCYTGNFTVAAALGGAKSSVSVDVSARALGRIKVNFALNELSTDGHRSIREDAQKWLGRAHKRDQRFDWVVVDPPSFSTLGKRVFRAERDLAPLLEAAARCVASGGQLLAVTHYQGVDEAEFMSWARAAAERAGHEVKEARILPPPEDCAGTLAARNTGVMDTKTVLVQVG